jgi:hypothetical protein
MPETTETTKPATPTAVEAIPMEDGSIVNFTGKRKLVKEAEVTAQGTIKLRLCFRNGAVREEIFTPDAGTYAKAAAHGYLQKFGDECAGVNDLDDMVQAIDELLVRVNKGEWTSKREAGSGNSGASVLARALVEASGKTAEEIKEFLASKSQAEKIALRNNPKIKVIVDRLEAEKLAKKGGGIDSDSLLDGLGL